MMMWWLWMPFLTIAGMSDLWDDLFPHSWVSLAHIQLFEEKINICSLHESLSDNTARTYYNGAHRQWPYNSREKFETIKNYLSADLVGHTSFIVDDCSFECCVFVCLWCWEIDSSSLLMDIFRLFRCCRLSTCRLESEAFYRDYFTRLRIIRSLYWLCFACSMSAFGCGTRKNICPRLKRDSQFLVFLYVHLSCLSKGRYAWFLSFY